MSIMLRMAIGLSAVLALVSIAHAGECMRSMTEARAKELEGIGQQ